MTTRRDDEKTAGLVGPTARIVWTFLFAVMCGAAGAAAHWVFGLICAGLGGFFVWERTAVKNLEARREINEARWSARD